MFEAAIRDRPLSALRHRILAQQEARVIAEIRDNGLRNAGSMTRSPVVDIFMMIPPDLRCRK
jgi:hypothetical protein